MTVSYQYDVASSASGGFTMLLFKWRGSLYKLIYRELIMFCMGYIAMSIIYRYMLAAEYKRVFEQLVIYCDTFMNYIPLSFILGFYVTFVATRWWQQYMAIPWPDKILHAIALHVTGYDDKGRTMRRTMVRYLNLSLVLVLRSISSAVKKRFPTLEHLVEAGFITTTELGIYTTVNSQEFNTYWIPCTWFTALLKDARTQKRITDPIGIKLIMEEFNEFRQKCGMLWSYDWVSIPLVYTQVVTISTYAFFIACIIGRQYVENSPPYKGNIDLYVPIFTVLQFFFYMGLLKVAEQLINPFGDDDEDFELNWIIDRHIKVSYLIVDTLLLRTPPLTKDIYYNDECPVLPYTEAAAHFKKRTYRGSVANMAVPENKQNLFLPDIVEETENDDDRISRTNVLNIKGDGELRFSTKNDGSLKSLHARRDSVRRSPAAAGSKGIKSALLAAGSHQGFFATNLETKMGELNPVDIESGEDKRNELQYIVVPVEGMNLDINDINYENETPDSAVQIKTSKGSFKLPASLKARIAVRKKPVIKWRPYHRPDSDFEFPVQEDLENGRENGTIAPGIFEDECAFMWKTIEDDFGSLVVERSTHGDESKAEGLSVDAEYILSYSNPVPRKMETDVRWNQDEICRLYCESIRRASFKYHKRKRRRAFSVPVNSLHSKGCTAISPKFLRSLSETSVFLETLARHFKKCTTNSKESHFIRSTESSRESRHPYLEITESKDGIPP